MLSFAAPLLIVSLLFTTGSVLAQTTIYEVIININPVTTTTSNVNSLLSGLTTSTPGNQVHTYAEGLLDGFHNIIVGLNNEVSAMPAQGTAFSDPDAQTIVTALDTFVQVSQALLADLIGKHGIFAQFAATAPIATVLRSLEASIDTFVNSLIDMVPTQAPAVQSAHEKLDTSVGQAITTYEQS